MGASFRHALVLAAVLALVVGGSASAKVAPGDVAVIGSAHVSRSVYNQALAEQVANMKSTGQTVPKAGTTAYKSVVTTVINLLVQQTEIDLQAKKAGVTVSDAEVETQLAQLKQSYFGGSEAKYQAGLKQEGLTDAEVRSQLKEKTLEDKLFTYVTRNVKVTTAQVKAFYKENPKQFKKPATRDVQEILVGKSKEALANQIYKQLSGGGSFTTLAKKYSQDPGSKDKSGKFTATQGSDVPEFDRAVFDQSAKTGALLEPVNTAQYGWFVIKVVGDIKPPAVTPESAAAAGIRSQLKSNAQQLAASQWLTGVNKRFCTGKLITYQAGFAPSPDPCATYTKK